MKNKIRSYIIGIFIPVAVGLFAAFLTRDSMNIYDSIKTPPLSPPAILFPIVWTVLYVLMGIGSTMIYKSNAFDGDKRQALTIYALQLFLNFLWSLLFFNERAFLSSLILLLLLWILIIAMILRFMKLSKIAAYMQIPYLIWVTFAGYLNLAIYILNK